MNFEILSEITDVESIAVGGSIHDLANEAHGIGRKEIKRKRYRD
jgi:hypothetical protein